MPTVPGIGIEAEEAGGLDHAVHANGEDAEGEGHHEAGEPDVFRRHLAKPRIIFNKTYLLFSSISCHDFKRSTLIFYDANTADQSHIFNPLRLEL